jgi:hypothetical protein
MQLRAISIFIVPRPFPGNQNHVQQSLQRKIWSDHIKLNSRYPMDLDVDIVRYNRSKKIAQLNKVVVFLSFHLEERKFQGQLLVSRYQSEEKQLLAEVDRRVASIAATLGTESSHKGIEANMPKSSTC